MQILDAYKHKVVSGNIKSDALQAPVIEKLATLALQLNIIQKKTTFGIFNRIFSTTQPPAPKGLYIYGEVGRGKTFLMDLFFDAVDGTTKRRIHFHAFMQDVHSKRATTKSKNIIADITNELASNAKLICLDEMQISDIADAMIIGRLFEALYARGIIIVTTSNLPPNELYKEGLNRQLFIPFIEWMNEHLDVIHLSGSTDYRLGRMASRETYLIGDDPAKMNDIWNDLTDHSAGAPASIELLGRKLIVPQAARNCARFTFAELCEKPLGAPDYLALTKNFRTIFIDDIPIIKASNRNEAKRFILMIDTFYDAKTKLVIQAEAPPEKLYPTGQHKAEFARTVSRLNEMQSSSWWNDSKMT